MNSIQQISLKIRLGLDPAEDIPEEKLRTLRIDRGKVLHAEGRACRLRRGFPELPGEPMTGHRH